MTTTIKYLLVTTLAAAFGATALPGASAADPPAGAIAPPAIARPDSVVVIIGNRLFPDFREIVSTGIHEKRQIGDTDFFFEVTRFLPHFAIIDSTRSVVSLSDEPTNPAFRIMVFEGDAAVDSTWAFFKLNIPHFTRKSALWFQVLAFDYRGQAFSKEMADIAPPTQAPHAVPADKTKKEQP